MGRTVYIRKDPSDWENVGSNTAWGMNVCPHNCVGYSFIPDEYRPRNGPTSQPANWSKTAEENRTEDA